MPLVTRLRESLYRESLYKEVCRLHQNFPEVWTIRPIQALWLYLKRIARGIVYTASGLLGTVAEWVNGEKLHSSTYGATQLPTDLLTDQRLGRTQCPPS
jgi:hypothetical protein